MKGTAFEVIVNGERRCLSCKKEDVYRKDQQLHFASQQRLVHGPGETFQTGH